MTIFSDYSLPPLNISQDLANAPESLNNSTHPVNLKFNFANDPQDLCCLPRCCAVYPLDSCLEAGGAAARRTSCWDTSSFPRLDEKLKVVPSVRRQVEYLVTAEPLLQVSSRRPPPTDRLAGPAGGRMGFSAGSFERYLQVSALATRAGPPQRDSPK